MQFISEEDRELEDIRDSATYKDVEILYRRLRKPGEAVISDVAELSATSTRALFAGTIIRQLEGFPPTKICLTDLGSGATQTLTDGDHVDRLPKFSPSGDFAAFLSDRRETGNFQLYLLDPASKRVTATPHLGGWVEYFHWSPDSKRILIGVAGHGADVAGGQGAITSRRRGAERPSWMPTVESGSEDYRWRSLWIYDRLTGETNPMDMAGLNAWEAAWCGAEAVIAVVSDGPEEGDWYHARLAITAPEAIGWRDLLRPDDQLGCPSATPHGNLIALIEAMCSDRGIVAGDLRLIDPASTVCLSIDTNGVDITYCEWRSETRLLVAGHRGFETVIGLYDHDLQRFEEIWSDDWATGNGRYVSVSGLGDGADCVIVTESFLSAPEIGLISTSGYRNIVSFDTGYVEVVDELIGSVQQRRWAAPDGLEICGWLLTPKGEGPYPLIMFVHGGPVGHWRQAWLPRRSFAALMLLARGYAVFFPNPRGSAGRGQDFARRVVGDLGGADTYDYLTGLDSLVAAGLANPVRLGVTGVSYGGFMTAWLITQDQRFAAAIPVAPVTNHVSEHLISNIPYFVKNFLRDKLTNLGGRYFSRSPVLFADRVTTPVLNICGALDRCTPPEEAVQFHRALLEQGKRSELVVYPEEGHGIRAMPAALDYAARITHWFSTYV